MSSSVGRKYGGRNELFSTSRREELALGPVNRRGQKASAAKARITVTVRKKPLTPEEVSRNELDVIDIVDRQNLILQEPRRELAGNEKTTSHQFGFDRVYDETCSNHYIYNSCVKKLVNTVFQEGTRCSCFAFGQTGSGKTYTMMGTRKSEAKGLWEWAAIDIIGWMAQPQFKGYELAVSFFEIHCNKAYDLLSSRKLVRPLEGSDGGVVVKDLTETAVTSLAELLDLIDTGNNARSTGRNSRNNESSRSHAILSIVVRRAIGTNTSSTYSRRPAAAAPPQTTRKQDGGKGGSSNDRAVATPNVETINYSVYGKIAFIDLAGSERGADTVQFGRPAQQDGAGINKSLLALKECIRAMDHKGHIPFRDSELTKILRDFFTNPNGLCLMIATISSSFSCVEQTLNTLRYAQRFIAVRQNAKPCIDELPENLTQSNQPNGDGGSAKLMDSQIADDDEEFHYANSSEQNSSSDAGEIDSADRNQTAHRKLFNEGNNRLLQSAGGGFVDGAPSSSSSKSGANPQPARSNRMLRRDNTADPMMLLQQSNPRPAIDSPTSDNCTYYCNILEELSEELDVDLKELLTDPFDARTREVLQKTIAVNNGGSWGGDSSFSSPSMENGMIKSLSDEEFRSLYENSSSEVWVSYREMLGHQTVYLRDVCQLIQAHVRLCKVLDIDLEKKNGTRPSLANNPATLPAKTASIDPNALETYRVFLEREIGLLLKLALELNRVQSNLQKCNQLEKEEKRRSVQTVQVFNNKRSKPTG